MVGISNFRNMGNTVFHSLGISVFRPLANCAFHPLGISTFIPLRNSAYHFQLFPKYLYPQNHPMQL